jgi:hypothetical protein
MDQSTVEPHDVNDTEALFRRVMAGATDKAWNLRVDDEALAALHDVIDEGTRCREAGENLPP